MKASIMIGNTKSCGENIIARILLAKTEHGRKKAWTKKAWKDSRSPLRHSNANFVEQKDKRTPGRTGK